MKTLSTLTTALALCSAFVANSQVTVLDFEPPYPQPLVAAETYLQGTPVTPQSLITTQYASLGVLMEGVALINFPVTAVASGTNGIGGVNSQMQIDFDAPLSFTFVSPSNRSAKATTDYFSIYPDLWTGSDNSVTVSAYSLDGELVGTASYQESSASATPIVLSGIGRFHRVVVDATLHSQAWGGIGFDLVSFGPLIPQPQLSIRCSQVEICWNSVTNANYQVQYRSDLTTNTWTPLIQCVPGSISTTCIQDAVVLGQPQRFYRVVVTNCVPAS